MALEHYIESNWLSDTCCSALGADLGRVLRVLRVLMLIAKLVFSIIFVSHVVRSVHCMWDTHRPVKHLDVARSRIYHHQQYLPIFFTRLNHTI